MEELVEVGMQLEKEHLEQIGCYVKAHINEWMDERPVRYSRDYEIDQRERVIRVEEELKNQRELMKQGFDQVKQQFEQVDRRFDLMERYMDKRFDDVNRRFTILTWMIGFGFTLTTAAISTVVVLLK